MDLDLTNVVVWFVYYHEDYETDDVYGPFSSEKIATAFMRDQIKALPRLSRSGWSVSHPVPIDTGAQIA